jgi:hypothetical protein
MIERPQQAKDRREKTAVFGLDKRAGRRIVMPDEADIEQLMKERVGKSTACINDWPSQNHSWALERHSKTL